MKRKPTSRTIAPLAEVEDDGPSRPDCDKKHECQLSSGMCNARNGINSIGSDSIVRVLEEDMQDNCGLVLAYRAKQDAWPHWSRTDRN